MEPMLSTSMSVSQAEVSRHLGCLLGLSLAALLRLLHKLRVLLLRRHGFSQAKTSCRHDVLLVNRIFSLFLLRFILYLLKFGLQG